MQSYKESSISLLILYDKEFCKAPKMFIKQRIKDKKFGSYKGNLYICGIIKLFRLWKLF